MRKITIEFDSDEKAMAFAEWLCNSGEQEYWQDFEYRGDEKETKLRVQFHYHGPENETKSSDDPERFGEFMCDWTIRTT